MTSVIYHITTKADADRLSADGLLEPASLATEGFVHCSTANQVVASTERHFDPDAELVLIELAVSKLTAPVDWPEVRPGEQYPHVHGPLNAEAVVAVHPWSSSDRTGDPPF